MSFLIFDTNKQSTHSLHVQLDGMSERPIRELLDWSSFSKLTKRKIPPSDVILFDQDGDPERVEGFRQELEGYSGASVVLVIGTDRSSRIGRRHDSYLRKPVFSRKLEKAVLTSYSQGQLRRSVIGYLGNSVPQELVREVRKSPKLWKQIERLDPNRADPETLASLGAVFVSAAGHSRESLELVKKIYRITSASRITIVGLGTLPEDTFPLRGYADFIVDPEAEWAEVLKNLGNHRLNRLRSEIFLSRARKEFSDGRRFRCALVLRCLLANDAWNIQARGLLAEVEVTRGRLHRAIRLYNGILDLNPCQPKPHLRVIELEKRIRGSVSSETLARARRYCPKLKELQGFPDAE